MKRIFGGAFIAGFLGLVVLLTVAIVEVMLGHGSDPVPAFVPVWFGVSFLTTLLGGVGFVVTELVEG